MVQRVRPVRGGVWTRHRGESWLGVVDRSIGRLIRWAVGTRLLFIDGWRTRLPEWPELPELQRRSGDRRNVLWGAKTLHWAADCGDRAPWTCAARKVIVAGHAAWAEFVAHGVTARIVFESGRYTATLAVRRSMLLPAVNPVWGAVITAVVPASPPRHRSHPAGRRCHGGCPTFRVVVAENMPPVGQQRRGLRQRTVCVTGHTPPASDAVAGGEGVGVIGTEVGDRLPVQVEEAAPASLTCPAPSGNRPTRTSDGFHRRCQRAGVVCA